MAQRLALIIGNSVYLDGTLSRLLTPEADVGALGELLLDQERGGFDDVKVMVNMSSHLIRRSIATFYAKKSRDDLLLLYFSGHGVLDEQGHLFLAVRDTDSRLLSGTGIPASYITSEMNNSHSQRQVLVLDCCHSGAFARGTKGQVGSSVGTGSVFEGTGYGRVVLTASDATQFAWEGEQLIGQAENSLFTHFLVDGIQSGKADLDGDGQITVDELYDYAYEQVIRQTPRQTPGKWSYKEQGEIVLSKAPSFASISSLQVKIPDFDQDQEQRLDQLYNEGLSAFWLEEWDKAVHCFQTLVELRGDYLDAVNKLELSRRNKRLLGLYNQALAAEQAGEWNQTIARLEELVGLAPAYKDAAAHLENARRLRQLDSLYQEARQLSQAEKWQAVVNVFSKVADLEPGYPDPEGLLPAARLKVQEIERRQTMENLYYRALHEMDDSNWESARRLLLELEAIESGYKGTGRLLAKLDAKITEQRAIEQRLATIAGLYEQAQVLRQAEQWSQALQTIEEIRLLDAQFADPEGIEALAKTEIEREKNAAQRQLKLNASYSQAVQLLEAGQYQQALEQWARVQELDPTYPDRQKVQATAKKKLKALTQVSTPKRRLPRWAIYALGGAVLLSLVVILTYPELRTRFAQSKAGLPVDSDFSSSIYNGRYDPGLWRISTGDAANSITQKDGLMVFTGANRFQTPDISLHLSSIEGLPVNSDYSLAADFMLTASTYGAGFGPVFELPDGYAKCLIFSWSIDEICCFTRFNNRSRNLPCKTISPGTWHNIRIDFMFPHEFDFYIDKNFIGTIQPVDRGDTTKIRNIYVHLLPYVEKESLGYLDNFSFGPLNIP